MIHENESSSGLIEGSVEGIGEIEIPLINIFLALKNCYIRAQWDLRRQKNPGVSRLGVPEENECLSFAALQALGVTINQEEWITEWPERDDFGNHVLGAVKRIAPEVVLESGAGNRKVQKEDLLELIYRGSLTFEQLRFLGANIGVLEVREYFQYKKEQNRSQIRGIVERPSSTISKNVRSAVKGVQANAARFRQQRGAITSTPFVREETPRDASVTPFMQGASSGESSSTPFTRSSDTDGSSFLGSKSQKTGNYRIKPGEIKGSKD
ncbi:hypothetical protein ACFL21_01200 [Patescibacteria group bacterium]